MAAKPKKTGPVATRLQVEAERQKRNDQERAKVAAETKAAKAATAKRLEQKPTDSRKLT